VQGKDLQFNLGKQRAIEEKKKHVYTDPNNLGKGNRFRSYYLEQKGRREP